LITEVHHAHISDQGVNFEWLRIETAFRCISATVIYSIYPFLSAQFDPASLYFITG